jgi:hypothetical protein
MLESQMYQSIQFQPQIRKSHSVVLDDQGDYVECIYERYPLASGEKEIGYVFFPHKSGKWGCNLKARSHIV